MAYLMSHKLGGGAAMSRASRQRALTERRQILAQQLFGENYGNRTWDRTKSRGFITVPCTMSLIFRIVDSINPGKPVSYTYFTLWCHTWDHPMVEIKNEKEFAFESGFTGERSVYTWKERMKKLKLDGLIEAKSTEHEFGYVLILNPYTAIENMITKKVIQNEGYINAFKRIISERVTEEDENNIDAMTDKSKKKKK